VSDEGGHRRIDRVLAPSFVKGLGELALDELRRRRDECLAEREYLSLLRRLVQGRAEILKAEIERRETSGSRGSLIERLSTILTPDASRGASRGEALRVGIPEDEMLLARRSVERLVADAAISDPTALDDAQLAGAVESLVEEERGVSESRGAVIQVLDVLQDELKRRYKQDPNLVLD
jgi:hypothetical protein